MALIMHQHIFIFSFLTIKEVTSQQKDRKSGHKELTSRLQDPTSRHYTSHVFEGDIPEYQPRGDTKALARYVTRCRRVT